VIAAGHSSSTAGEPVRTTCVSGENVPLNLAIGYPGRLNAAEAGFGDGDMLYCDMFYLWIGP
jgi:hypothetical protein